jgi:hypothetical protein
MRVGPMEVWNTATGEANATIFDADGNDVGVIEKIVSDHGATSRMYRTDLYEVIFFEIDSPKDRAFACQEYARGQENGARAALAAAKAYVRSLTTTDPA